MRHTYLWSFLIATVVACSQQTTSETEAYRAHHRWTEPGFRVHRADASAPDAAEPADAEADAQADVAEAGSSQDAGATKDSGSSMIPAGWLYTQGNKVCGYNGSLWMTNPGSTVDTLLSGLVTSWKPTFVRMSLGMNSYTQESWTSN